MSLSTSRDPEKNWSKIQVTFRVEFYYQVMLGGVNKKTITMFHINDFHRRLHPLPNGLGGAERLVGKIRQLETLHPDSVTVDLGDVAGDNSIQGPDHFSPIPELWNRAGVDIMALGNHEFEDPENDYASLKDGLIEPFQGEVLVANVQHQDGRPIAGSKSHLVRQFQEYSIAFVGLVTRDLSSAMFPAAGAALSTAPLEETLLELVPRLKAEGADAVVVLAHENTRKMAEVVKRVPGVDLAVTSHDHRETPEPVEVVRDDGSKVWLAQAGAYGASVGQLNLEFENGKLAQVSGLLHPVDDSAPSDPVAADLVANHQPLPRVTQPPQQKKVSRTVASFAELAEALGFESSAKDIA